VSAWLAPVVPAIAALLGVVLGQWHQARREEVRWQRERERDAKQRATQRERDRLAWERADRNQLTSEKRELYGRLMGLVADWYEALVAAERRMTVSGDVFDGTEYRARTSALFGRVSLIAPFPLADQAIQLRGLLQRMEAGLQFASSAAGPGRPGPEQRLLAAEYHQRRTSLHRAMRADIGV
jgi:hypothetical protein